MVSDELRMSASSGQTQPRQSLIAGVIFQEKSGAEGANYY
jgi:hypothetical protein